MRKKSQGHKKRSNITGDVNTIDFVFIQVERSPNVRGFFFFMEKISSSSVWHHQARPVSITCHEHHPAVLSPISSELATLLEEAELMFLFQVCSDKPCSFVPSWYVCRYWMPSSTVRQLSKCTLRTDVTFKKSLQNLFQQNIKQNISSTLKNFWENVRWFYFCNNSNKNKRKAGRGKHTC